MKKILTNQYDEVSGGWADMDGSGIKSASNGGSNSGGNSGNPSILDRAVTSYYNNPYGSGSGASGYWGGGSPINGNLSGIPGNPNAGGNGGRNH